MKLLDNLKYTKTHEWIKIENGIAIEGITDFAQSELSDIAFVELPQVDKQVKAGDVIGTIEAVKAVSDLVAGLSGEIVEVNNALNNSPSKINEDPYNEGWIVKIKPSDLSELDKLMDSKEYEKFCEENHH